MQVIRFAIVVFLSLILAATLQASVADRASAIVELIADELPESIEKVKGPLVVGDRFEYWADDPVGQFMAIVELPDKKQETTQLTVALRKEGTEKPLQELRVPQARAAAMRIDLASLREGKYTLQALQEGAEGKALGQPAEFTFTKSDKKQPAVRFPTDGIPLVLEGQKSAKEAIWPVRCGVPMPLGVLDDPNRLALFEDGKQVPAQIAVRARWHPRGSIQWVHVDFLGRYRDGQPATYRLKLLETPAQSAKTALRCKQTDDQILVDTGVVRFVVNRQKFTGIESAWIAPQGDGRYDLSQPIIKGSAGPYLVDGRLIRFDASKDQQVKVEIEEQGPVRVTIVASGWYTNSEGRVEPLSMFKTRITAFAGQPLVRISHHTIITYDTRLERLADAGFDLALPDSTTYRLGYDGQQDSGELPPASETVSLHQFRYDHLRITSGKAKPTNGKLSDGWFSLSGDKPTSPRVDLLVRDIWQKFPKEVELSRSGFNVHFWPKNGVRAFNQRDELDIKNIYKFWCFHQGPLLDLNLPDDYYSRLANDYREETWECRPELALNGNGQGLVIGNEFALVFRAANTTDKVPVEAALFEHDPTALCAPRWNASTGALGKVAAADSKRFGDLEEAMENGFLSYTRSMERGREYGMWNYADTHTYWKVEENRADLHRVWHNSHYHEVGGSWLMLFRTGSPEMLRWARKSVDHYMNVDTINYANSEKPFKFHLPGAMYHCKGLTHWGGEAYGMERRDSHAGLYGHWVDPDAFLWCWYIDGNSRAKDVYDLWTESIRKHGFLLRGTRREANTTLAIAMTYYQASGDPSVLPAIHGLGRSLRMDEPLEKQNPGPMWHPLWINRYYEQTRDPEYPAFIAKYARDSQIGDTWTLPLAALAYDLTKDRSYLEQHFVRLSQFPRRFYRAKGDPYDWYGVGPGPLGCAWGYMGWPYMAAALRQAGIEKIEPLNESAGFLPLSRSGPKRPDIPPSAIVVAFEGKDQPFEVRLRAKSIVGDMHQIELLIYSPSGKLLKTVDMPSNSSGYDGTETLPADGETGAYRLEFRTHEAMMQTPITTLPSEVVLWSKNQVSYSTRLLGYLWPLEDRSPIDLKIASSSITTPCDYRISDADGKLLASGSLFQSRTKKEATVTLDPSRSKLPWRLDVVGQAGVSWQGKQQTEVLWGESAQTLKTMLETVKRNPPPRDPSRK